MSQRGGVSSRECTHVGTSHYKASVVQAAMWRGYCVGTAAFGCPSPEGRLVFWPHNYQESRPSRAPKSVISALNFRCTGPIGRSRGRTAEGGCLHKF